MWGGGHIINPIRRCRSSCKQKYNHESTERRKRQLSGMKVKTGKAIG